MSPGVSSEIFWRMESIYLAVARQIHIDDSRSRPYQGIFHLRPVSALERSRLHLTQFVYLGVFRSITMRKGISTSLEAGVKKSGFQCVWFSAQKRRGG